jgi:multidrug efflux pump subunit AcrB
MDETHDLIDKDFSSFSRVEGAGQVNNIGGQEREIQVNLMVE